MKNEKTVRVALGVLVAVGGLEHIAQASGYTLLTLPLISLAPVLVQAVAGISTVCLAYLVLGGKK